MKFDKCMSTLAIEMTRRCNLNCNFCGKGTAQEEINMISPEWCKGLINFLVEKYKNENKNEGENE